MGVKNKILITVSCILIITLLLGYFSVNSMLYAMLENDSKRIQNEMFKKWQVTGKGVFERYNTLLDIYKEMALFEATLYSRDKHVIAAYEIANSGNLDDPSDPKVAQARRQLKKYFHDNIEGIRKSHSSQIFRLHFHTKNIHSLARVWRNNWRTFVGEEMVDIADDLSGFRNTIKQVRQTRENVTGIELGKEGLVVRGVCPVFGANNEYMGSVEYIWPLTEVTQRMDANKNINHALYIPKSYLKIAERLRNESIYPLLDNKFVQVYASNGKLFDKLVGSRLLASFENDLLFTVVEDHYIISNKIYDFSGNNIGLLVISIDVADDLQYYNTERAELLDMVSYYKYIFILGCLLSFVIIFIILYVFLNWILKRLDEATEKLTESEENFRGLITHQVNGFALHEIILDKSGTPYDYRFLLINPAFERMTGLSANDVVGKTVLEILPNLESSWIESYGRVALERKSLEFENYSREFEKYFEVYAFSPKKYQFACVFNDVTQKKLDEIEKTKLQEELLYSEKMRVVGQLAGGVAHDFNNKLSVIIGACELLQKHELGANNERLLDMIMQAAEFAADLSQKLLTFGHRNFMPFYDLDILELLDNAVTMLREKIPAAISFEESYEVEKPIVNGDRSQLFSCFVNIGMNAYQAMPGRGVILVKAGNVELNSDDVCRYNNKINPGLFIKIEIKDTGKGISEDNLAKIFEPFFSTKGFGDGNGLGLSAALGAVEHHSGAITIDSVVDVGTTVTILLPCKS